MPISIYMDFGILFPAIVTICSGAALLICAREFMHESMQLIDSRRRTPIQMIERFRDRWLDDIENQEFIVSDSAFEKIIQTRAHHFRQEGRSIENSSSYLVFMGGLGALSAVGFIAGLLAF